MITLPPSIRENVFLISLLGLIISFTLIDSQTVYGQSPGTDFVPIRADLTGVSRGSSDWGDYDGDGDLDLVITGKNENGNSSARIYENKGNGDFEPIGANLRGVKLSSSDWGDYDNDGNLNLVVTGSKTSKIYEFKNGNISETGINIVGNRQGSSEWGDYDSDGKDELVITGDYSNRKTVIYDQNENGGLSKIDENITKVGTSSSDWGDYDGDGDLDLVISGSDGLLSRTTEVYENKGGSFEKIDQRFIGVNYGSTEWGDYDNDGDLDLLVTGYEEVNSQIVRLYENKGDNNFQSVEVPFESVGNSSAKWEDYNDDGFDDVIISGNANTGKVANIYKNNKSNGFDLEVELNGKSTSSIDWGDYDNDGDIDLVITGKNEDGSTVSRIYGNKERGEVPEAPFSLQATAGDRRTWLTWDAGEGSNISGYNVYRSKSSFSDLVSATKLNSSPIPDPRYVDSELSNGTEYFYRVTAVGENGTESGTSGQVSSIPVRSDLNEGLVAYYPFNGTAEDASGNGNDGALNGDPQFVNGQEGEAIQFDGNGDFVQTGSSETLRVDDQLSLAGWVYVSSGSLNGKQTIAVQGTDFDTDGNWEFFIRDTGRLELKKNNTNNRIGGEEEIGQEKWVHVAVSFESGTAKFYVDGSLDSEKQLGATSFNTISDGIKIGDREYTGDDNDDLNGRVDEFRVYNRALTGGEVKELAEGGGAGLATVRGRVTDAETGNPVENAEVSLEGQTTSDVTGTDGQYQLSVSPGTGYVVTASAEKYFGGQKPKVSVGKGESKTVDLSLRSASNATPTVQKLSPDPNPKNPSIGIGGTLHRHYRVLDQAGTETLPGLEVTLEGGNGGPFTARSDELGIVSFTVPASAIGDVGSSATFTVTSVGGRKLPLGEQLTFTAEVETRPFQKRWALRTFGSLSGGVSVGGEASLEIGSSTAGQTSLLGRKGSSAAAPLQVHRRKRGGIGLSLGVGTPRIEAGPAQVGAGASVGSSLFFFRGDAYEFNRGNDPSAEEAAARFYVWARSNFPALASNNLTRMLTWVIENYALEEELDGGYELDEYGLGNRTYAEASFQAGVGTFSDLGIGVGAGIRGDFEASLKRKNLDSGPEEISAHLSAGGGGQTSVYPLLETGAPDRTGEGSQFRQGLASVGEVLETLNVEASLRSSYNVGAGCQSGDTKYLFFERGVSAKGPIRQILGGNYPEDAEEVSRKRRYRFQIEPALEPAWSGPDGNETAGLLADACSAGGDLTLGRQTFSSVAEALGGQSARATRSDEMAYRPVQYEVDSTLTRSETGFDLTVGGAFGIQASIGGGFSFAERSSATVEEGVWALGQHFPNKRYEKLPGLKTSYKDVVGELIQDLRPNWWDSALSFAEEIVNPNSSSSNLTKAADSTYSYQIGDNGTTAVFDRDAVPATVDSIQGVSWGWWGAKTSTTARDLGQEERALKAKVKAAAEEQQGMRYGIGGFYRLRPLGTDLQAPSEITIHYSEEELGDVDEEELSVYWENTEEGTWEYVGGTVDPDSNTVTARIDTFRTFTLAPSLPSGSFDLEPGSPTIQADDTSEVSIESTALSSNDGSSIQDGALYTVGTDLGRVASPDADTTRPGTQVRAENGKITFSVESSRTPGTADLSAKSVRGHSTGAGSLKLENTGPPPVPEVTSVEVGDESLELAWDSSSVEDLAGYKIYFGPDSTRLEGVAAQGQSSPIDLGNRTEATLRGLSNGQPTYVAVSAYDAAEAESQRSVARKAVPQDTIPPAAPKRLRVAQSPDSSSTRLSWVAPGDNGTDGRAADYRVRYGKAPVKDTSQWWEGATPVEGLPGPSEPGVRDRATAPPPSQVTTSPDSARYAVRVVDEVGNKSPIRFGQPGQTQPVRVASGETGEIPLSEAGATVSITENGDPDGGTLQYRRVNASPSNNSFGGSATAPDGSAIEPDTVAQRYWLIESDGLSDVTFSVELDASGTAGLGVPNQRLILKREGPKSTWKPLKTTRDGDTLSTGSLSSFSQFTIGGSPASAPPSGIPSLAGPEPEADGVPIQPTLSWDSVGKARQYRVEISQEPNFTGPATESYVTGDLEYTLGPLRRETTYHWRVRAENSEAAGTWSAARQFTTRIPGVAFEVSRSFGQASGAEDYRLVALPGVVDRPLGEAISGEPRREWQAYWDTGAAEDYFTEYDGSDTFDFRPGRGFWLTSRQQWTVSDSVEAVPLGKDGATAIPLHEGWNIISNPLRRGTAWGDIKEANSDSLQPAWAFEGSFRQADTLRSATTGQAYYFLNDQGLDSLKVPYTTSSKSVGKKVITDMPGAEAETRGEEAEGAVTLVAEAGDIREANSLRSKVKVGISGDASSGIGSRDVAAPPSRFSKMSLQLMPPGDTPPRQRRLAAEWRPPNDDTNSEEGGNTFSISLRKDGSGPVEVRALGLGAMGGREVALLHPSAGESWDLRSNRSVTLSDVDSTGLKLAVGDDAYVENKRQNVLPDEVTLTSYPNPIRDQATLEYTLPEERNVRVEVYDVLGRRVAVLKDSQQEAGRHEMQLNAGRLASGVYFGRLEAGEQTRTQKITVVR